MRKLQLLSLTLLLSAAPAIKASQILVFNMNTSSISGTTGSLDFQFNAGSLTSQAATVTILNFMGGSFTGAPSTIGSVSGGPLPSPITISNNPANALNDYFQGFTFGNSLSFAANFSGPAVDSPNGLATSGSEFLFSAFSDANGTIPVLTPDPDGIAGAVQIAPNGAVTSSALSPNLTITPEPSSVWLLAGSIAILSLFRRLRLCKLV